MLVICGPDLAGKTTLATELVATLRKEGFNTHYAHMNCPKSGETEIGNLRDLVRENGFTHDLVVDRFLLGDFAYRTVWPRDNPITGAQFRNLAQFLRATNSRIFLLLPSDELITQRYHERGDELVSLDKILVAAERYRLFAKTVGHQLPLVTLTIPWTAEALYGTFRNTIERALLHRTTLERDLMFLQAKAGYVFHDLEGDTVFEGLDDL